MTAPIERVQAGLYEDKVDEIGMTALDEALGELLRVVDTEDSGLLRDISASGPVDEEFEIDVVWAGSGTSTVTVGVGALISTIE